MMSETQAPDMSAGLLSSPLWMQIHLIYIQRVVPAALGSFSGVKTSEVCKETMRSRPVGHLEAPSLLIGIYCSVCTCSKK